MKENLKELIKRYVEILNSEHNVKNREYWQRTYGWGRDMQRLTPRKTGKIPFTIVPDNSFYIDPLKITLDQYYLDPVKNLETQLRIMLYRYENFDDNYFFTNEVHVWFGVATELSMFNNDIGYHEHSEPWINNIRIKEPHHLDTIEYPDFFKSGLMPKIHEYYNIMGEYAGDELRVMFPEWVRGPFCHAFHLCGMENLLISMYEEPEFVHRLMRFLVDSRKGWNAQRDKFLGIQLDRCKLWNDEIDGVCLSPEMYREFVFPYEKELSDYFGEVSYWHSCGKLDPYLPDLNRLTNLRLLQCSPWTDLKTFVNTMHEDVAIDICLNPSKDILDASQEQMRQKLIYIKETTAGRNASLRADTMMHSQATPENLDKLRRFAELAHEIL